MPQAPPGLALSTITPNPAVADFRIAFTLPRDALVRLTLLDLQGREVGTLAEARFPAGRNTVPWNRGRAAPIQSGVYFVRMQALGASFVRRVILLR